MFVHLLRGLHRLRFGFFDHRIDHVGLAAEVDLLLEEAVDLLDLLLRHVFGDDRLAARRQFIDDADVQVAVDGQRQRARNGRRGHDQHVRVRAFFHQRLALLHAEAVLLIDDRQTQLLEFDIGFEQRVRADHDLGQPGGDQLLELRLFARGGRAGEQNRHVVQLLEQLLEIEIVLRRQDFGGREHRRPDSRFRWR